MSDPELPLLGLISVAEEQQATVKAVLARLAAQEEALKQERQLLAGERQALVAEMAMLRRVAADVGPALGDRTSTAVRQAISESMKAAGDTAMMAMRDAAQPVLAQLAGVKQTATEVNASLRRTVGWVTWRLLWRIGAVVVACLAVVVLANISIRRWTERDIAFDKAQKAVLEAEIAGLEDKRDQLLSLGARATISQCGDGARPCIRINEAAGSFGDPPDYRIIKGY
jgi:cell division protein FtsB